MSVREGDVRVVPTERNGPVDRKAPPAPEAPERRLERERDEAVHPRKDKVDGERATEPKEDERAKGELAVDAGRLSSTVCLHRDEEGDDQEVDQADLQTGQQPVLDPVARRLTKVAAFALPTGSERHDGQLQSSTYTGMSNDLTSSIE